MHTALITKRWEINGAPQVSVLGFTVSRMMHSGETRPEHVLRALQRDLTELPSYWQIVGEPRTFMYELVFIDIRLVVTLEDYRKRKAGSDE